MSSRLPIGVAQTASGTSDPRSALSVERLETDECGPDQARFLAELGLDDPQTGIRGLDRLAARRGTGGLEHEVTGGRSEAASDDHEIGIEDVDERADGSAEQLTDPRQGLDRVAGAFLRPRDQQVGIRVLAPERLGCARRRLSRRNRLQMAVAVTVPLTGRPTGDDDDVPELRPAAIEAVVEDDPAADAGAESEHD